MRLLFLAALLLYVGLSLASWAPFVLQTFRAIGGIR